MNEITSRENVEELATSNRVEPLQVMLITEGTYPFHWGGVSTWCHLLIRDLPEVDFKLLSLVVSPQLELQTTLPPNVTDFRPIPLWGVREVLELRQDLKLAEVLRRKKDPAPELLEAEFLPTFLAFFRELLLEDEQPERLAHYIHALYRFFKTYDFDTVMRSEVVWQSYVKTAQECFQICTAKYGYEGAGFNLEDLTSGLQWLYHWFFPLATPLPRVDVAHASMAGISTMIGAIAKLEFGAAFLLSEHGIYLRERYLDEATSSSSIFQKLLKLRFARRMTDLSYAICDQISPCCDYNQRWEIQNGATPARLKTIYYAADDSKFYAAGKKIGDPPVVVWVGRINPLKDVITLLRAAAKVHEKRPDIKFLLFGTPPPQDIPYYEECLALHKKLGLEECVTFAGYAANTADAYNKGDVVVLSSISEGFPFSTLEAMICGKPVVGTAVGGVPEQIEGCGLAVEPRNPDEMAEAILTLMNDTELCASLGQAAREKALQEFSVRQSREAYLSSYLRITDRTLPEELLLSPGNSKSVLSENENNAAPVSTRFDSEKSGEQVVIPADGSAGRTELQNHEETQRVKFVARRRLQFLANPKRQAWVPGDPGKINTLADEVKRHDPHPLDYLEVAALLESLGMTDEYALQEYSAPDTFELAKVVLDIIRAEKIPLPAIMRETPTNTPQSLRQILFNYAQGPMALLPGLLVLIAIQIYGFFAQKPGGEMVALGLGMSAGMLLSNGFLQAVMRRASICISLENWQGANKFLLRSLGLAGVFIVLLALLVLLVTEFIGGFSLGERLTFCLAFTGLSAIWLAGGPLVLVQKQIWLGIALGAGLVTGLAVDRGVALFSDAHLFTGTVAAFLVTIGLTLYSVRKAYKEATKSARRGKAVLPSPGYLINEAMPYFTYGMLYVAFILLPHFLGWFGKLNSGEARGWAIASLEGGLTFALPPLILVSGFAERTLRLFWQETGKAQKATEGSEPARFGKELRDFYHSRQRRYSLILGITSLIFGLPVWFFLQSRLYTDWSGSTPDAVSAFFLAGLVSYYWLGQGLFNCMFSVTLARPNFAVRSVLVGLLVMLAIGLPLSLDVDFRFCLAAYIAGAVAFVIVSGRMLNKLFKAADYYYFTSF